MLIACIALIGMSALWGMSFPIMKSINLIAEHHFGVIDREVSTRFQTFNATYLVAIRFTFAMLFLVILLPSLVIKATRTEWKAGALIGVFFFFGLIFQVVGLGTISASRSGFLTSLTAVYTPLLSALILKERLTWQILCGSLLALVGVAILSDVTSLFTNQDGSGIGAPNREFPLRWGDLWTTLGALFFSGQVLLVDYFGKRYESIRLTAGMFLTAALLGWGFLLLIMGGNAFSTSPEWGMDATGVPNASELLSLTTHPVFIGLILHLALFGSVVTFVGMNKFQPRLTAGQASVIYSTEPVFASLWAMLLPGFILTLVATGYDNEPFTWQLLIGGLLILCANVVALLPPRRNKQPPTKP